MTLILIRIVIIVLIFGAIFLGARRIWRDWKGQFKQVDQARHDRDLKERARPDVVTLKRDKDGKFRQPDDK
jgi:cytoskeletal protein RodZ